MSLESDSMAKTPFSVLSKTMTLPKWLGKVASQSSIDKGMALANSEKKRDILKHHVVNDWIITRIKTSRGGYHVTKVRIWDRENGEIPRTSCSCEFGFENPERFCYHKVAFVLRILSWNTMPEKRPVPKYEDDFELD